MKHDISDVDLRIHILNGSPSTHLSMAETLEKILVHPSKPLTMKESIDDLKTKYRSLCLENKRSMTLKENEFYY